MIYSILFSFLGTIVGTLLGTLFGLLFKNIKKEITSFLVNFSIGSLFALTFLDLFQESLEHMHEAIDNNFLSTLYVILIVFGVGVFFYFLHEALHLLTNHHHKDKDNEDTCEDHAHTVDVFNEKSLSFASFIFLIAISIHNIPEGLTLGISFITPDNSFPISGVLTSITLMIHNFIIGFTMFNSFKSHGKNSKFSLGMTLVSSLPAFIFALVGYFISSISLSHLFISILFAISTGSLIYVLFIEMIPSGFKDYKSKFTFLYILLGLVTFVLLLSLGGHSH